MHLLFKYSEIYLNGSIFSCIEKIKNKIENQEYAEKVTS